MPDIQHKRGTLAALNDLALGSMLMPGQVYVLTDVERIAVALTSSAFQQFAKLSEMPQGVTIDYVTTQAAFDSATSTGPNHIIVRLPG